MIYDKDLSYVEKKYKTIPLHNFGAIAMRKEFDFKHYIVAFESKNNSLIAHEVVHLVNYIFLDIGIELDRINDENQAYLTGWLFETIEKFLNE